MTRGYDDERGTDRGYYRDAPRGRGRGIPDSLLIGLLAFLLGLTLLVWTATGLAGLFTHGAWPDGVTYPGTPMALRHLVSAPHDMAAAWPDTPKAQLSGYGLFWGILIGELMVLLVLTIFTLGTVTRYRAVRAARRAKARAAREFRDPSIGADETGRNVRRGGEAPAPRGAIRETAPTAPGTLEPLPYSEHAPTGPAVPSTPAPPVTPVTPPPPPLDTANTATIGPVPEQRTAPPAAPALPGTAQTEPRTEPALPRLQFGTDRTVTLAASLTTAAAAPGPLIVATTDPTLWSETKDTRAKLGPLLTYDPTHRLDTPARLRWSPTSGCTDLATAAARATALLAPVRPAGALDSAVADAAQTLLRCWLHAAAVDGRPFRQLHRWAHTTGAAQEPVRILRTSAKASGGQAGELESVLTAHPERREAAQQLVGRALTSLSSIHIRDACNPLRTDSALLESFIDEGGTLYVVGDPIEDPRTDPGAMPLLTALLSHVVEHGRRMAERSSDGRLDPPLTLVLDDIAALAPLPALPTLLQTGGSRGLLTLATMRSREQARARWPHHSLPA
ncbi:TraM recognition domain-containing protein [Streptomyces lydicus]|uniref:TraM recognition domain-containing protein n=1 Tax=Streptomyces lydicus TaxID=47763 RepID=UPI0019D71D47|nr:TraM recognition domain-containing protein [Streptomyces lydicus]MCZ1008240.1 type VI secretion protein [Streptomyces lydicus]